MTALDILMLMIAVGVVVFCALQRTLRAMMLVFGFYLVTLAVGMLTTASDTVYRMGRSVLEIISSRTPNTIIVQSVVFLVLFIPALLLVYFATRISFPDTSFPKLGALDYILGMVFGMILALLLATVVYNTWGVIVSVKWQPQATWNVMWVAYRGSLFRPFLGRVSVFYLRFLFPLRYVGGYPPFFIPQ